MALLRIRNETNTGWYEWAPLSAAERAALTGGGDTALHWHASDRDLANATGTLAVARGGTGLTALGTANQLLAVNAGTTGLEYKTLSGTTNRVSVAHAPYSITLSLPQDIHTGATPTFAGLTVTGLGTFGDLEVTGAAGTYRWLRGFTGTTARWQVALADSAPESGGNAGSDFGLFSYDDAGQYLRRDLTINRATGLWTFGGNVRITPLTTAGLVRNDATGLLTGGNKADLSADTTGILPIAKGGTAGTAAPTAGAIAYGTGSAYAFTAAGAAGQLLSSSGSSAPVWISQSAVNAGQVDGFDAAAAPAPGVLLALDGSGKFPNSALHTGSGGGLDADMVDGQHASAFAPASHTHYFIQYGYYGGGASHVGMATTTADATGSGAWIQATYQPSGQQPQTAQISVTSDSTGRHATVAADVTQVNGTLEVINAFRLWTGAAAGYVLTSDAQGYGTWQPPSGLAPQLSHNSLQGLQGGAANEYYHLTAAQNTALTGGSDTALHYHASDRDLSNHTGVLSVAKGGTGLTAVGNPDYLLGVKHDGTGLVYKQIAGTANQVTVTPADGSITISLPQNVHTGASPTFAGATLTGLTPGSVVFAGSGGQLSQDNTGLYWDAANRRLGVRTGAPTTALDVAGSVTVTNELAAGQGVYVAKKTSAVTTAPKWIRIAQGIGNCFGLFEVRAVRSGIHSTVLFTVGAHYGDGSHSSINVLAQSFYANIGVSQLRLLTKGSGDTMYIEAYPAYGDSTYPLTLEVRQYTAQGWQLIDHVDGSVPSGYAEYDATIYSILSAGPDGAQFKVAPGGGISTPDVNVNGAAGAYRWVWGSTNNSARWRMALGDTSAESGGNAGSDFGLFSYDDAGQYLRRDLTINRATGLWTFGGNVRITPLTQGSVLFAGASGVVSQNTAKLFWDNTNFRLGIGTNAPAHSLHVYNGNVLITSTVNSNTTRNNGYYVFTDKAFGMELGYGQAGQSSGWGLNIFGRTTDTVAIRFGKYAANSGLSTDFTELMTLTTAGRLGIGVVNPAYTLEVGGTAKVGGNMWVAGVLDVGSNRITSVATPTAGTDAANKAYVDAFAASISWLPPVLDKDLSTPPASPATGDRYIVKPTGTGAWASHDNQIAQWNGSSWAFTTPTTGNCVFVRDEGVSYEWNGSAWVQITGAAQHHTLPDLDVYDDHAQYARLRGRSGGQALYGGTGSGESITIRTTQHASKGYYYLPDLAAGVVKVLSSPQGQLASGPLNLAGSDVTGLLPASAGGTGQNSYAWTGYARVDSGVWSVVSACTPTSHTHAGTDIVSTVPVGVLPVGTAPGTVAAGDHTHTDLHPRLHTMDNAYDHTVASASYVRVLGAAANSTTPVMLQVGGEGAPVSAGHGHPYASITHASTHHSGGSDALTLSSIAGAITAGQHGLQTDASLHAVATTGAAGFMSASDKTSLNQWTANASALIAHLSSSHVTSVTAGNGLTGGGTGAVTLAVNAGAGLAISSGQVVVSFGGGGTANTAARSDHTHDLSTLPGSVTSTGHGAQPANSTLHAAATTSTSGFMSSTDKQALDLHLSTAPHVPTSRYVSAGDGLVGGGQLSGDVTLSVGAGAGIVVSADSIAVSFPTAGGNNGTSSMAARSDHLHSLLLGGVTATLNVLLSGGGYATLTFTNGHLTNVQVYT